MPRFAVRRSASIAPGSAWPAEDWQPRSRRPTRSLISTSPSPPVVIIGGHGLVAGCYLARAGKRVLVLEAADKLRGGCRTDETIPGYLFNTHSAAHNIINSPG